MKNKRLIISIVLLGMVLIFIILYHKILLSERNHSLETNDHVNVKTENNNEGKDMLNTNTNEKSDVQLDESLEIVNGTLIGYYGSAYNLVIPDTVTSIDRMVFFNCNYLIDITIPTTVTWIGASAFESTPWLDAKRKVNPIVVINGILIDGKTSENYVIVPETVTTISDHCFRFNKKLTGIKIPETVTYIGIDSFYDCRNLESVKMSDNITYIGSCAFMNCRSLNKINLSNSLTSIFEATFENCYNLSNVTIPGSVTTIEVAAFRNCKNLKSVTIPHNVTSIGVFVFASCNEDLIIYGVENSYAQSYAKENDLNFNTLALNESYITLSVNDTSLLYMNSMALCHWESSNASIASVNANGIVKAKEKGTAIITANLYGKNYECIVTVN